MDKCSEVQEERLLAQASPGILLIPNDLSHGGGGGGRERAVWECVSESSPSKRLTDTPWGRPAMGIKKLSVLTEGATGAVN